MKRVVLFSQPDGLDWSKFSKVLFPYELENKIMAYMPTNGSKTKQVYTDYWRDKATANNSKFVFIDNTLPESANEKEKIRSANILLISGGNTFDLLNNLRKSGLDKAVVEFSKKDNFVLAGFSAGALVFTPNINMCNLPGYDENLVGLKDLSGLRIIDFEVYPHFDPETDSKTLGEYRKTTTNEVRPIQNNEHILIDLE